MLLLSVWKKRLNCIKSFLKTCPYPNQFLMRITNRKCFFSESKIAQGNGKLKEAEILFKKAEIYCNHANTAAAKMLRDYFNDYSRWKNLANDAIAASRGGNKVILVDKVAHILYVYQSGKAIRSYDV